MFENRAYLIRSHSREMTYKLIDLHTVLKILEEGGDRDSRTAEHPRTTYALRITFNGWA